MGRRLVSGLALVGLGAFLGWLWWRRPSASEWFLHDWMTGDPEADERIERWLYERQHRLDPESESILYEGVARGLFDGD